MNTDQTDIVRLLERVCASTIATNAALKCMIAGRPLTVDNVIKFVGEFFDPELHSMQGLVGAIESAINDVVGLQQVIRPIRIAANQN